jgi:hypothetical protein
MTAMLSLPVRAADGLPTWIIDARLALAPGGLLFALQLASMASVWLTRRFWGLIDSAFFYRRFPHELLQGHAADDPSDALIDALALWHTAWLNGALNSVFYCIGDAGRESALPVNWNSEIVGRFERLAEAFAAGSDASGGGTVDQLTACGYEACALAAAMTAQPAVILTVAPPGHRDWPPAVCLQAARTAQIDIHGPNDWMAGASWADKFVPDKIRPLLHQLAFLDTQIVAVHMLVPQAVTLSPCPPAEDSVDFDRAETATDRSVWCGAHAFWHRLT